MKNTILKFIAHKVIQKYKPIIVGVTGSVGKTSTKEAIYAVVKQQYRAFRSERNLNTESGLPISVMAIASIPLSKWGWRLAVLKRVFQVLFTHLEYPEVLILEYGADKPGDIEYLLSIVKPDIAVLTAVAPTHLEQFGSVEAVRGEKMKLLAAVQNPAKRIFNADLVAETTGVSYGIAQGADVRALEISQRADPLAHKVSMVFKIQSGGSTVPCELSGVLGNAYVSSALAAIAVGQALGMNVIDCVRGLADFHGKSGHMRVLGGVKQTAIVDDTYNSSPVAVKHAIDTVAELEGFARKWMVLADMLELGADSVRYHREAGEHVAKSNVTYLVTVGERARDIARGARGSGMDPDRVFDFEDTLSAGRFVQDRLEQGDLVLVKGSQGMKMERVVRELMAEPERADELLVRRSFGVSRCPVDTQERSKVGFSP